MMTVESRLAEKNENFAHIATCKSIKKKRPRRRVPRAERPVPTVPMALQRLFVSCRDVFKGLGTVPSPGDVQKLCYILDGILLEDFGLSKDLPFFKPKSTSEENTRVTCTTVYECENFSLCIFFLPATGIIPLHNHPEMTVFSKLLLGSMHIKAYDWADDVNRAGKAPFSTSRLARLKANRVFTAPCNTSVLYPTSGGNIHAFTAMTPCAVLDVIGPPYSKEDGRDGSYYKDAPYCDTSSEQTMGKESDSYGWLEEIETPEDAEMEEIPYLGPQITETGSH